MYETGVHSGRGARIAWAATRPAKAPGAPFADHEARLAPAGRTMSVGRLELERAGRARRARRARRAPLCRSDLPSRPRRRPPPRRRGGIRRGGPRWRQRLGHRPPRRAMGPARVPREWRSRCFSGGRWSRRTTICRALGPRPVDPDDHAVWLGAAVALDAYRDRWGLAHAAAPLGEPRKPGRAPDAPPRRPHPHRA